jgi:hypothetical protein
MVLVVGFFRKWVLVLGSLDHPISTVEVYGDLVADGESLYEEELAKAMTTVAEQQGNNGGPGGGSGGSLLLFLKTMTMGNMSLLSSVGGHGGLLGGGGGGGGRVHFHWSNIATGEDFVPLATGRGLITTWWVGCLLVFSLLLNSSNCECCCDHVYGLHAGWGSDRPGSNRGGTGSQSGLEGESGTVTGKPCPQGLYGLFCEVCMAQQFFSCRKMTVLGSSMSSIFMSHIVIEICIILQTGMSDWNI